MQEKLVSYTTRRHGLSRWKPLYIKTLQTMLHTLYLGNQKPLKSIRLKEPHAQKNTCKYIEFYMWS